MVGQGHGAPLAKNAGDRFLQGIAGLLIHNPENVREGTSASFDFQPLSNSATGLTPLDLPNGSPLQGSILRRSC